MEKKERINKLSDWMKNADAVMIGAGAGLSTAAGYVYTGERFERYFADFSAKYGFRDMYSGGFYPYATQEEFWAYWSRYIWVNRYLDAPTDLYSSLFRLVKDKDYFVLTTNVDHCFQKAGFDKKRLFYTQGDYGLFQCTKPCCKKTWDNRELVKAMLESQGYIIQPDNTLSLPEDAQPAMRIDSSLLPKCPSCGRPLTMNLRSDDKFVEDEGWQRAAGEYKAFVAEHANKRILYLEIGVGWNTPGIIKYNFWRQANENRQAHYACLNYDDVRLPREIAERSIGVDGDSSAVIDALLQEEEAADT